jgi:hypothetical protein
MMTHLNTAHQKTSTETAVSQNNRILPFTRWTAILILPFLLAAWGILYLFPQHTEALFAWPITPEMSARLMGAGYLAGAYFFIRAATNNKWHTVQRWIPSGVFLCCLDGCDNPPALVALLAWEYLFYHLGDCVCHNTPSLFSRCGCGTGRKIQKPSKSRMQLCPTCRAG